jgi:pimeloyl-ACP methyl ester carboxylesterase
VGRLGEIRAPTLVVVGDLERPEILAATDLLAREVQGTEKAVMRGAAHLPNMERPEEFNALVTGFLGASR